MECERGISRHFPSFSEGLSLRAETTPATISSIDGFPFLFGGTFIEGSFLVRYPSSGSEFPFLFGGTFIEGAELTDKGVHVV